MEPGAEFTLGQDGLVSSVHLHGELECQRWVGQVLGCLLQSLKVQSVVESAHVQQDSDSMFAQGLGGLLAEQAFQGDMQGCCSGSGSVIVHGSREVVLPRIHEWLPHLAPDAIEYAGQSDWSLHLLIFGQHDHQAQSELGGQFSFGFHGLEDTQKGL